MKTTFKIRLYSGVCRLEHKRVHVISVAGWLHENKGFEPVLWKGHLDRRKAVQASINFRCRKSLKVETCTLEDTAQSNVIPLIFILVRYLNSEEAPRVFAKLPDAYTEGEIIEDMELPLHWLPPMIVNKEIAAEEQIYNDLNTFLADDADPSKSHTTWLKAEYSTKIPWKEYYRQWDQRPGPRMTVINVFSKIAYEPEEEPPTLPMIPKPDLQGKRPRDLDEATLRAYFRAIEERCRQQMMQRMQEEAKIGYRPLEKQTKPKYKKYTNNSIKRRVQSVQNDFV